MMIIFQGLSWIVVVSSMAEGLPNQQINEVCIRPVNSEGKEMIHVQKFAMVKNKIFVQWL